MTTGPVRQLDVLPDGTVRQQSPVTGTVVWTVPGRSHRPLPQSRPPGRPLDPAASDSACSFCPTRYLETTPEKTRLVADAAASDASGPAAPGPGAPGPGAPGPDAPGPDTPGPDTPGPGASGWRIERGLSAEEVVAAPAAARRIPNLFEILPLSYWQANHDLVVSDQTWDRARRYLGSALGERHVRDLLRVRQLAAGNDPLLEPAVSDDDLARQAIGLFASMHDVVVGRRHFVDAATADDHLCSAGDLTPQEHAGLVALTVDGLRDLAGASEFVRYVAAFQNWLAPAGASIEHLHKQLVAIDEHGPLMTRIVAALRARPDLFNDSVIDPARADGLVVAGNDHALALAGVGHRYPTVEIYATGSANRPWEHDADALRGVSDLLHACHAATGRLVPTNEEWHYRPLDVDVAMPWRINLKWRVSTLAGFEGGTKINVNTISPFDLRARLVGSLVALRDEGRIAALRIGDECHPGPAPLRYREGR